MNKILTALIQCFIVSAIVGIFTVILLQILRLTKNFMLLDTMIFRKIFNAFTPQFIAVCIISVFLMYIMFLLTVYLSITLGKVAIKIENLASWVLLVYL